MSKDNLLLVADSEHDANMLYAVRMFVPDPFVYLRIEGKCHVLMSDLEIDRARKNARHCKILSLSQYQHALRQDGIKQPALSSVIRSVLKEKQVRKVAVPGNFPHGLARELEKLKIKVKICPGPCFPQ